MMNYTNLYRYFMIGDRAIYIQQSDRVMYIVDASTNKIEDEITDSEKISHTQSEAFSEGSLVGYAEKKGDSFELIEKQEVILAKMIKGLEDGIKQK